MTSGLRADYPPATSAPGTVDRQLHTVLGGLETHAVLVEGVTARVAEDSITLRELLRGLTVRVGGPLGELSREAPTGAMPLAAAQAAEGLQRLLGVCAAGQDLTELIALSLPLAELSAAREVLSAAIATIDLVPAELAAARQALNSAIATIDILGASNTPPGCVTVG